MSSPTGETTQKDTPISVTPSPLDMPGAQSATIPAIVNADARSLDFAEAKTTTPAAPAPATALTDDERNELERLRAVHADEKKWEKRSKENFEKATKLDAIAESFGQPNAKEFDPQAELQKLRDEIQTERTQGVRERIARETGVPPSHIHGTDEASMTASATAALEWAKGLTKQSGVPLAAPAATVTSNEVPTKPQQIQSRDDLKTMTPQQILAADKEGRLDFLKGKS